jgi:cobalt-zinc-cadmium efflux system membrane fusion protein
MMMGMMRGMSRMMGAGPMMDGLTRIQPGFACRVEQVHVKVGQTVKKGDPLLDLLSFDLAEAKSNYELARSEWLRDRKLLQYKRPLVQNNTLPKGELVKVEGDESQSRLKMKIARDKLLIYGLTEAEIENIDAEDGKRNAHMIFRSPVAGRVVQGAVPGNHYDTNDVLMVIDAGASEPPAGP